MSLNVVIIGAVACGPKSGSRIKRLMPEAKVTMIDRDDLISYGGCGIPFYVSGDVAELKGLQSTAFHMVRDAAFFKGAKGLEVMTRTEALAIDRQNKTVRVRNLDSGAEEDLPYDKLVMATGSRPFVPPIPGADLDVVLPVANLHQAQAIKKMVAQGMVERAAIIGAGATGLEMAEALADLWGVEVHIFEMAPQVLPGALAADMAHMLAHHLEQQDEINLHLGCRVEEIMGEDGRAAGVRADGVDYPVDMVIMATGVRPNIDLAADAGLEIGESGGIRVNHLMQTSDPDIYAGGDCASLPCMLTGRSMYIPAGSLANREGRVIGSNVCGASDSFPGVLGTFCIKLFGLSAARTGLDEDTAVDLGLDVVAPLVVSQDRAHFHPDAALMYMKLVVERGTRRVLGCTAVGVNGDAVVGRVDAVAALLALGGKVEDVSNMELAYSPPLGAAVDILNAAGNVAENMLSGRLRAINPGEFSRLLAERESGGAVFLDVRAIDNVAPFLAELAPQWQHLPQETMMDRFKEVPKDRDVILVCNSGARSYEAQRQLDAVGITNTVNVSGGVAAVRMWGESIIKPKDEE